MDIISLKIKITKITPIKKNTKSKDKAEEEKLEKIYPKNLWPRLEEKLNKSTKIKS